ncbi:MAG: hypothetical protein JXQ73_17785 [Phycisphaerae bacterium]|nr:hypothetical protein [Phycisphaerae bacterium]
MSTDRPSDRQPEQAPDPLDRHVDRALREMGWTVPQTEDDVRSAEVELAEFMRPEDLPPELNDPGAVLDRPSDAPHAAPNPLQFPQGHEIEENLARAAREGIRIPPELEEILRRDREAAERGVDHGQNAE